MKPNCCSACGRTLPKPKAQPGPVDTSTLSEAELFAHYKRTALAGDLAFLLRFRMSAELRARCEAIQKPNAGDLAILRSAWRAERSLEERQQGRPSIGSPAWTEEYAPATEELAS